jgi:putative (di)nucleoside polyphosphate hydrolase
MLLHDPEVQLLMEADGVNEHELMTMLNAVKVELRERAKETAGTASHPTVAAVDFDAYRPGIGIMLLNERGEIFIGHRADVEGPAWQMPQGGISEGELPREAAMRELKEEIGTDNADIIAESKGWLFYDVPDALARKVWDGRWRGQRQKWFVMLFKGNDCEIDLGGENAEFDAWRWAPVEEITDLAVSFKRQLYMHVLGEFATIFRD